MCNFLCRNIFGKNIKIELFFKKKIKKFGIVLQILVCSCILQLLTIGTL